MLSTLRPTLSRLRKWWQDPNESKKQTYIAIAALVVAIIALSPVISDWNASPEERLTKLGYKKTYDEFWRAISNKHPEAAALFAKAKVRLEPRDFHQLFDDRVFDSEIIQLLIDGEAINKKHCPTNIENLTLYLETARNPQKAKIIRKLCANAQVTNQIGASRAAELELIAQAKRSARERPENLKRCAIKYRSENQRQLIDEAAHFDMLSQRTLSERQCVISQIYIGILTGYSTRAEENELVIHSIAKCCVDYNQSPTIDDSRLRTADEAIAILKDT